MKKMNAPVMETVRFTEDDVIVASGAGNDNQSILMSNFGNTTTNDGFIRYNGTTYSGGSLNFVHESLKGQLGYSDPYLFNTKTGVAFSLGTFIESDLGQYEGKDNGVSSDMNGSYYWNSDIGIFEKR